MPTTDPAVLTRRAFVLALAAAPVLPCAARDGAAAPASMPLPMLASEASPDIDPAGFLVSEKFDGVRALWDGERLRFRSGGDIAAPRWFVAQLPAVPLDGELWLARGRFEALVGTVRKATPRDDEWRQVRYLVFDLPRAGGAFVSRHARLQALAAAPRATGWELVEQRALADRQALRWRLDEVLRAGGEGLMLHRADALYQAGRSGALLKLKPVSDAEAVVVGQLPGRGRHQGRLGGLRVRLDDGREFTLGTGFSDAQRDSPPPPGSIVSYTYRGETAQGLPRFASFLRVRELP